MSKRKIISYLAGIFLLGAASGALVDWEVTRYKNALPLTAARMTDHILSRIDSKVNLSAEQKDKIVPIVTKAAADIQVVNHDVRGRISVIMSTADAQIATELTPEQKIKFEQMEHERREFFRKKYPAPEGAH